MRATEWQLRLADLRLRVDTPPTPEETARANAAELRMRRAGTIPNDSELVKTNDDFELWLTSKGFRLVIGEPSDWVEKEDDHDCDAMGCGGFSHVVAYYRAPHMAPGYEKAAR